MIGVPQPWSVGDAIGHAAGALKKNLLALFLPLFLVLASAGAVSVTSAFIAITLRQRHILTPNAATTASSIAAVVIELFFFTMVSAGLFRAWIAAARGEKLTLNETLRWLKPRAVFRLAWVQLVLLLASLIPFSFGVVYLGLSLAPHFVVDQDMKANAALRASWRASRGNKGSLWLLGFCFLPIQVVGLAAGVVGVCASTALVGISVAYAYTRVTGRSEVAPYTPEFATRSMRIMLRTTLGVSAAGFLGSMAWVHALPPVRGSAWTPDDAAARVSTIVFGISSTILLLASLLPWILDRLEGARFSMFVGARHVRSQKSGFLTVISILSICGVAISSCALSSVISVMGGFSTDLKRKILGNNAHIVVDTVSQQPFADYRASSSASARCPAWSARRRSSRARS